MLLVNGKIKNGGRLAIAAIFIFKEACNSSLQNLHIRDDVVAELGALDFRRAGHLAREIAGNALAANCALDDEARAGYALTRCKNSLAGRPCH